MKQIILSAALTLIFAFPESNGVLQANPQTNRSTALLNGKWFDGKSFEPRTVYSVDGRLTAKKPTSVDSTLDLAGAWIVPPFAEAHNHNIDGASEERSRSSLRKYLSDGVFYVKIQGNFPLSNEMRSRLPMNRADGPDVVLAQTFITATGGHPIHLHENILMQQGYYPGLSKEQLQNNLYFTIDSAEELEKKWPQILKLRPDFIKTNLWCSDEYEKRKTEPAYLGRRALDPRLLPRIVAKSHAQGLTVSVHITNAADFHFAVAAGVDEIVHTPSTFLYKQIEERAFDPGFMRDADLYIKLLAEARQSTNRSNPSYVPLSVEDVKLAARRGIVVITTAAMIMRSPEPLRAAVKPEQVANFTLLRKNGVLIAIGSDNPPDSSVIEADYLQKLGVFDNLTLLKMWSETTARTIFPKRRIGELKEGYEASFLALEGNPLENWQNVRKIKLRFKQGILLER